MEASDDTGDYSRDDWFEFTDSPELYRAFVESTTDIFTHIDPDGEMTYVTSTEEMTGRSRQEFLETPLEAFLHPEDKERGLVCFKQALAGEPTKPVELRFRHRDGYWIWIETSTFPVPTGGDLEGIVTVSREITERKLREQEVEETQAELEQSNKMFRWQNRRLDRFASVVSHDLQNPLSVASGRLVLAGEECHNEHLDAIERALNRMASMIDELQTLLVTQHHVEETTLVSIAQRAKTAWETTDTGESNLDVLIDQDIQYEGNPGLLDHIFENLFRNAVVHNQTPVTVTVSGLENRSGFSVADDGTGIPSTRFDAVLEHGYTTEAEGTGFGLGIVNELVEAHGWELAITESEAGGARFEIYTT